MLLEPACSLQALRRIVVVLCAEMTLCAVFDNDECEGDAHDSCGQTSACCPIVGYSMGPVEINAKGVQVSMIRANEYASRVNQRLKVHVALMEIVLLGHVPFAVGEVKNLPL